MNLIISSNSLFNQILNLNLMNYKIGQEFILFLTENNQLNLVETSSHNQLSLSNYFTEMGKTSSNMTFENPLLRIKIITKTKDGICAKKSGKTTILNQSNDQTNFESFFNINLVKNLFLCLYNGNTLEINFRLVKQECEVNKNIELNPTNINFKKINQENPENKDDLNNLEHNQNTKNLKNNFFESPMKSNSTNEIIFSQYKTPKNKKHESNNLKFGTGSTKLPFYTKSRSPNSKKSNFSQDNQSISKFFPIPRLPFSERDALFGTPKNSNKGILPKSSDKKFKRSCSNYNNVNYTSNQLCNYTYVVCFSNLSKKKFIYY